MGQAFLPVASPRVQAWSGGAGILACRESASAGMILVGQAFLLMITHIFWTAAGALKTRLLAQAVNGLNSVIVCLKR